VAAIHGLDPPVKYLPCLHLLPEPLLKVRHHFGCETVKLCPFLGVWDVLVDDQRVVLVHFFV